MVPSYLQEKPKQTILHCLHREASSNKFMKEDVTQIHMGKFEVKGKKGSYKVSFGDEFHDPKCTCKDWLTFHLPCKHFFAIFHHFLEWDWGKLLKRYLTSPYLSSDNQAIAEYISSTQQITMRTRTALRRILIQKAILMKFPERFVIQVLGGGGGGGGGGKLVIMKMAMFSTQHNFKNAFGVCVHM